MGSVKCRRLNSYHLFTGEERVMHAYKEIPDEATTIDRCYVFISPMTLMTHCDDRLWPTELINKDSRIRRELSAQGRNNFSCKEYEDCLGNSAL